MLVDLTLKITSQMAEQAQGREKKALVGHLGTHFDVMNRQFPLEYTRLEAVVFDVSHVRDREIEVEDIDVSAIRAKMFVGFHTGFIEEVGYGEREYFTMHPQLSEKLIRLLVEKEIAIIGIDFAGLRRGKQHTPTDQYCADHNVFVVENLCNLSRVIGHCTINTYPMNYADLTGLPCRVIAEI